MCSICNSTLIENPAKSRKSGAVGPNRAPRAHLRPGTASVEILATSASRYVHTTDVFSEVSTPRNTARRRLVSLRWYCLWV